MGMVTETGWAIASRRGLYIGWHMTRNAMIAEHVEQLAGVKGWSGGPLTPEQLKAWGKMKANGDRAVKIKITYAGGR